MLLPTQNMKSKVSPSELEASRSAFILWNLLLFFMSYRQGMRVTKIMVFSAGPYGETGYYICPRCSVTMEREFMAYCDRCGQKLDWKHYKKANVVYPGKSND
ncbi:MAG: hypothetical protein NC489_41715 [Ruminococcus flavefaciens]|nr:hypothetical protein [Ruminococcus flavefaciens]